MNSVASSGGFVCVRSHSLFFGLLIFSAPAVCIYYPLSRPFVFVLSVEATTYATRQPSCSSLSQESLAGWLTNSFDQDTTWNDDLEHYDIYGMSAYDEWARSWAVGDEEDWY